MDVWEKSQTVDPEVRAYIYSLVSAVGGSSTVDDDRYAIGDDALAVLNDLLRWLRLYDEKTNRFDVKRCLAEANLVKGDLLEILASWPEEQQDNKVKSKLALACLQLLVPLTWPLELDFEKEKTTVNHLRHTPYLRLAQCTYKRAVLQHETTAILRKAIRIALPSMAVERRERTRRDEGIIKMLLYFLRNIALITQPADLPSQGDENDISRSATISAFAEQEVFTLLLTVASGANDDFNEHDVIVLETLFHLLKGIDPKKLFLQQSQLASDETTELQTLIQKERAMRSSYNKHAPTRHNRFGTMLWVKRADEKMSTITGQTSITDESTTLLEMDRSKKWDKPKPRSKVANEFNESADFSVRVDNLSERARQELRTFAEEFLDSGFNPLFSSLRKAIEREAPRVGEKTIRQYFYLISWFLSASAARRETSRTQAGENTYAYIAAVLDQETFVLLNRSMQSSLDDKNWQDVQSTLLCFTQILLTVQSMSESEDEEDQEIAENILSRLFYEEATLDRIVQVLRGYANQGLGYLDAVTECVHVFLRMLERYSKQNVDLQVRSKRRARRKQKKKDTTIIAVQTEHSGQQTAEHEEHDNEEDNADDTAEAYRTVSERKFDFARFSSKFLSQPCVNTFIALLHFYADLSPSQLKRCHRYFYRLAFKNEMVVLLFRVDILALFHKMIKGPGGLSSEVEGFKEWEQLIQQVFRRCVKWISRQEVSNDDGGKGFKEAAVVEMLFSKINGTLFYLQNGYERLVEKRVPRPPAELEVKRSVVGTEERVGVVVCVLLELGKGEEIGWIKKVLKSAVEERCAWEERAAAERELLREGEGAEKAEPPTIFLSPGSEERKEALFKDKYLRLLLSTAGAQRLGTAEDVEASWILPSELSSVQLKQVLEKIEKTEFDPPTFEDGKKAQDLIRSKSFPSSTERRETVGSDSDSSGSDREIQFPPNAREKRKRSDGDEEGGKKKRRLTRRNHAELTDAQAQAKADERRKHERERNAKIKSALLVTASDDESDVEGDAEFFRAEEERRRKMKGFIREALAKGDGRGLGGDSDDDVEAPDGRSPSSMRSEKDGTMLRVEFSSESGTDDGESGEERSNGGTGRADEFGGTQETPSTSPAALDGEGTELPLSEVSGNVAGLFKSTPAKGEDVDMEDIEDGDDDEPVLKPAVRRNVRAGFIVESDSE